MKVGNSLVRLYGELKLGVYRISFATPFLRRRNAGEPIERRVNLDSVKELCVGLELRRVLPLDLSRKFPLFQIAPPTTSNVHSHRHGNTLCHSF